MKKKIRILKDKSDNGGYTFLNEDALSLPYDVLQGNSDLRKKTEEKKFERKIQKEKGNE